MDTAYDRLERLYGTPVNHSPPAPLDELIGAVLSQHTSDANSHRAFRSLIETLGPWDRVAKADVEDVAIAIRSGGLANQKAPRIKEILGKVIERSGGADLEWIRDATTDVVTDFLTSLPGVGPKTAACVILFSLGRGAFPVDTHVHRLARRIGLVDEAASAARVQAELELEVPEDKMFAYHVNLIRHGRRVCLARRPRCVECPLTDVCRHYREVVRPLEEAGD